MPRTTTEATIRQRHRAATALAALILALFATAPGHAARKAGQGTVSGTVTSLASGAPVAGAEITLVAAEGTRQATTTDKKGDFSIRLPAGDYVVVMEAEGYARFEIPLPVVEDSRQKVSVELLDAAAGRRSEAARVYNVGAAALEAGDSATAKRSFLAAAEADPSLPEPHAALAVIYFDEGDWAEAAQAADKVLAARPGDGRSLRIAYQARRELGDTARVIELRGALGADPELASKLAVQAFNEGAGAIQKGDAETAEARFGEALALDAGLAAAHFALATLQFQAERYDQALATLDNGLALEGASAQGRRLAFLIHEAKGDEAATEAAIAAYAEVDAAAVVEIFYRRGEVGFDNSDLAAAIKAMTRVISLQPENPDALRILGLAYLSSDIETGKKHLRRFLELAPGHPEAATVSEILASLD